MKDFLLGYSIGSDSSNNEDDNIEFNIVKSTPKQRRKRISEIKNLILKMSVMLIVCPFIIMLFYFLLDLC